MNKKGFTLIELLAIIIILALIMMIAVPTFNKYVFKTEVTYYKNVEKTVVSSAKEYLSLNKEYYPKKVSDYYLVTKDQIINSGIVENITDKNGNECEEAVVYVVKEKNAKYNYVPKIRCGNYSSDNKDEIDKLLKNAADVSDGFDKTAPEIFPVSIIEKTTTTVTLKGGCSDPESGIREYLFSNDGGIKYISNGRNPIYTFRNLISGKDYNFKVKCINNSNLESEIDGGSIATASLYNPTIRQTAEDRRNNKEWAVTKTYTISNNNNDILEPKFYFRSTALLKVPNGFVSGNCGKENIPGKCSYSKETVLKENTWYITDSKDYNIIYGRPGTLYVATGDGINISGISSMIVAKVDEFVPVIKAKSLKLTMGTQDYDFMSNIIYQLGISGGTASCNPTTSRKTGIYTVTCTAYGGNGINTIATFTSAHSYPAVEREIDGGCAQPGGLCTDDGWYCVGSYSAKCKDGSRPNFDQGYKDYGNPGHYCNCAVHGSKKTVYECPQGGTPIDRTCYY